MNNRLLKKMEPFIINFKNNKLIIENKSILLNLSEFSILYQVSKFSKIIEENKMSLSLKPEQTKEFDLIIKSKMDENLPYYLNVFIMEVDHIVAFNQFLLKDENKITYHKDIEFDKIDYLNIKDNEIVFKDFKLLDIDKLNINSINNHNKSIDIASTFDSYNLTKNIMETSNNKLSIRYTYFTNLVPVNKLGLKIEFDKLKYNNLIYFGDGPNNSDKYIKVGLDSIYKVKIDENKINRSNVRIVELLDELNHGLRIEYADVPFNIQIEDNYLYINIRDEYSINKIKENSEYSFELTFDLV